MINENVVEDIKSRVTIYDIAYKYGLQPDHSGMIVCPFHRDGNASLKLYKNNTFHCFGCGANGDIFDFVKKMEECDFKRAIEIIGGNSYVKYTPVEKKKEHKFVKDPERMKRFILGCKKHITETNYFEKRGIAKETQSRFNLGFAPKYNSIVIPYNKELTYYQSRNVETKKFFKPNIEIAGSEPLFNESVLLKEECVFVVESPICALSIEQCGYNAVALCGTQGWKQLSTKQINDKCRLILCLDNDFEGKKAQRLLKDALPEKCVEFNVADECKDINELLMKDAERLQKNLDQIVLVLNKYYYGGNKNEI